ncbi:MAG: acyl-CoA dehydrogenase family protein, partial [Gammaproteobacteria bacterium]
DESATDEGQRRFTRIATAIGKYWITKRAIAVVAESLECIGGNGYVEESPLARLYRDVPLNSLWEGAGNVQCLDVLRAMHKDPDSISIFFAEIRAAMGVHHQFDRFVTRLETEIRDTSQAETRARRLVEGLALALQGALLLQHAPSVVAEAFCTVRLGDDHRNSFGTLPGGTDFEAIIERARPQVGWR